MRGWFAIGFWIVGCSLSSLDSLDDNAGATKDAGVGVGGTTEAGAGGGSNACVPSCERKLQAGCQADTLDACMLECQTSGANIPQECMDEYGALLSCAASGSYICAASGKASLVTCSAESTALAACNGTATGGGGGTGGSSDGGACVPGGYENATCTELNTQTPACTDCVVANCCSEIDACFGDLLCASLYNCSVQCSTASDPSQCIIDECQECVGAVNAYNAMNQCVYDHCSSSCQSA